MTAYSTTLLADGKDKTLLRVAVTDFDGREITSADNSFRIYVDGDAWISKSGEKKALITAADTSGRQYMENRLENGLCLLDFHAGTVPGKIKVEILSDTLWPASHEIHTIPADVALLKPTKDQRKSPEKDDLGSSDQNQLKPAEKVTSASREKDQASTQGKDILLPPGNDEISLPVKNIGRMIGADISFLPQLEEWGRKFYDQVSDKDLGTEQRQGAEQDQGTIPDSGTKQSQGAEQDQGIMPDSGTKQSQGAEQDQGIMPGRDKDQSRWIEKDAIELLRDHGFNHIRLRIFVNPENEEGYSPERGFCGLDHTLAMTKRVKNAGMKLLLNFHYSDYWADPQQQNKPLAWADLDFETLKDSLREYTRNTLLAFEKQGTLPDMVQVGNEVNHGLLWPDGHISNPDNLAELLKASVEGIVSVDPEMPVMMHIALGGQHEEAVFWLDNMIARGVTFDVIGISYYPRWHGTLDDLKYNLTELANRYHKYLNVVEYAVFKKEVHDIVFNLPDGLGTGTCIWEPLGTRFGGMFNESGEVQDIILIYDELSKKYLSN
jgi:arabinogalactan endo-1,4-beta-galactosidase